MGAPQPPPLAVFISAQTVSGEDMPSQRLPSVAAIETNHIVSMDGPSHRYSGSENLVWLGRLRPIARGSSGRIPRLSCSNGSRDSPSCGLAVNDY